jgi:hypothetical protein
MCRSCYIYGGIGERGILLVKRKAASGIMLTLLLIGMLTLTFNIQLVKADTDPEIIHVDDDNVLGPWNGTEAYPYQNITSGLEHASAGDTIFVHNGTYNEDIIVNKTVWLKGENRSTTTIKGTGTINVIKVTAPNVRICGFTINYSGVSHSCILMESQNLTVDHCKIVTGCLGIDARRSSGLNVTNNIIVGGSYACIVAELSEQISITYNEIVAGGAHGIDIDASSAVTVAYNNISHNDDGVYLCNHLGEYYDITICKNYIANNTRGIQIEIGPNGGGSSATIVGNTITNNTYAVHQFLTEDVSCYPHSFYHNNFINNTNNNITFSREAMVHNWDDGYPSGGNYWSNYNGNDTLSGPNQDKNGWDGIEDTAHIMNESNVDNYPAMNMWPLTHLQVHTFAIEQGEIENVKVWVNATEPFQNSTAYFLLKFGTYSVKVELWFLRQDPEDPTKYYRYTFDHWEDGSNQNPRTVILTTDKVLEAYYKVKVIYIETPQSE